METDSPQAVRMVVRGVIAVAAALVVIAVAPGAAGAASIAYVYGGHVWLLSLDGTQKVRLATPVVNGAETEPWLAVAASDGGRIVAVRNAPRQYLRFLGVVQGLGAERHVHGRGAA